jgi:hypothetical protein
VKDCKFLKFSKPGQCFGVLMAISLWLFVKKHKHKTLIDGYYQLILLEHPVAKRVGLF